jgi:adenosylcobyric acid synthase
MIQGTGSGVGKSVLCAAFCRIFYQDGLRVAPFKSQNMSLNSFVTRDGLEMARSQVVQAEAAHIEPSVDMNPILLKPSSDTACQVILQGKVAGNYSADAYGRYVHDAWTVVCDSYRRLARQYEVILIEGAGSPAEVNLKDRDIVNMRTAEMAHAPVLLAADIDKGGVFASLIGTLELLEPHERARIKGFLINKFRGDVSLLAPGIDFLEKRTNIPVLGVIPYFKDIYIQEEDGVVLENEKNFGFRIADCGLNSEIRNPQSEIDIVVLHLPHISNFTDLDALAAEPGVQVRYTRAPAELAGADVVVIPGSKNTIGDLLYLRKTGLEQGIREYAAAGGMVIGICGGYQMLGLTINDPLMIDGDVREAVGMGLLPVTTVMQKEKQTVQVAARTLASALWDGNIDLRGYEIHMGRTKKKPGTMPAFRVRSAGGSREDGAQSQDLRVWGTYLHGLFDSDAFRKSFLNGIRQHKGMAATAVGSYEQLKQDGFEKLAATVRASLDMQKLYAILQNGDGAPSGTLT